jgi:transcriptional regulator with XRE-family HTH domain
MKTAVITPEHSKQAREELNISQSKAALGAGINRAYLSQFESGSRILDDESLENLIGYYFSQGWEEPDDSPIEYEVALSSGTFKACDGFLLLC